MGLTKIEWTDYSFNPWWGCARISPGCARCYAERDAARHGQQVWRRHGPRRMLSDKTWNNPVRWNREAEQGGAPLRVFCASMADVFEDHPDVAEPRRRLWGLIEETPWLRWQLLTKRPENVAAMVPWGGDWPPHVWLGTSVENQRYADERIPVLLAQPAKVHFLSCEPLLGPVTLRPQLVPPGVGRADLNERMRFGPCGSIPGGSCGDNSCRTGIDWVIAGGESGPKARPAELEWFRGIRDECARSGVPYFGKQLGAVLGREFGAGLKGGDWDVWPADLKIRDFPREMVTA
jgi:protein gp37